MPEQAKRVRLTFAGEVVLHARVLHRAMQDAVEEASPDFSPMFREIAPTVRAADLASCVLGSPMAPLRGRWRGYPRFASPPSIAFALAEAGFGAVVTATNHAFDCGAAGVTRTIDAIVQAGAVPVGTRRRRTDSFVELFDVAGITLGYLAATFGVNEGTELRNGQRHLCSLELEQVLELADQARALGAGFVVAAPHWGREYQAEPAPEQRGMARQLLESGAVDLIVGNHVHVIQPVERIADGVVAYGTGNLLSNQTVKVGPPGVQDGVLLHVDVESGDGRLRVSGVSATPTWVQHPDYLIRSIPTALADPDLDDELRDELEASAERTFQILGPVVRRA